MEKEGGRERVARGSEGGSEGAREGGRDVRNEGICEARGRGKALGRKEGSWEVEKQSGKLKRDRREKGGR